MVLDFLETDASPEEIQEFVSLGGPNVETITQEGSETVYDIEVTANRIDAASAFGFALECAAILPRYGKKAHIKTNPLQEWSFDNISQGGSYSIDITLADDDLATRVAAIVIENVTIGASPQFIQDRLQACGISVINNVVDISNYVMILLGQPNHTFDYDKIESARMIIRRSKKGEKIMTLDEKEFELPGDDVVVEDGSGELVDLAGIMGGHNSSITHETKNVLLFIETYNKYLLRKTSMTTGQRSMAVSYFEKGLDEERVEPALVCGTKLLIEHAGGAIGSQVYDIYPKRAEALTINVSIDYVHKITNTDISGKEIADLIAPLGFKSEVHDKDIYLTVPSYRAKDVTSQADIVEEVARIYGYHNIPGIIEVGEVIEQPLKFQYLFDTQSTVRDYLRALGFNEQYNYSMVSKKLLEAFMQKPDEHLHITNTISEEIEYMRTSLVPSLVKNVADNKGYQDNFNFFECARTYVAQKGDLPFEEEKLALVSTEGYIYLKGIIENLCDLLKVHNVTFVQGDSTTYITEQSSSLIKVNNEVVGYIGIVSKGMSSALGSSHSVVAAELSLAKLVAHIERFSKYEEPAKYARIKRDLTYTSTPQAMYNDIRMACFNASEHLLDLSVISIYKDKVTLRCEFGFSDKNMTEEEAQKEFEKITALVKA